MITDDHKTHAPPAPPAPGPSPALPDGTQLPGVGGEGDRRTRGTAATRLVAAVDRGPPPVRPRRRLDQNRYQS